jgi:hypothetical protein
MAAAPTARPTAAALRKLAREHSEAAVEVLAEVATQGSSEASRVTAAMALLERGYGKSGNILPAEGTRPPIVYYRIELIDGTRDEAGLTDDQAEDQGAAGNQG